jgi:RNA polymerase sigma-70 factor, ECF subfamily
MFRRWRKTPAELLQPAIEHADERLMLEATKGDLAAFNVLVGKHERVVLNLCWRMLGSVQEAEDATQETFFKAWTKAASFRGGTVRPWLLRIATNVCYDAVRARRRRPAISLDSDTPELEPAWTSQSAVANPEVHAEQTELSEMLNSALGQLSGEQRLAITLFDIQGLPLAEVAQVMLTSTGTVKSRLSRGRANLRDILLSTESGRELLRSCRRFSDERERSDA